ncbi:MAG: PQQ-binding-like beta-propeller repeat protein [Ignavibacteriales bacterium]
MKYIAKFLFIISFVLLNTSFAQVNNLRFAWLTDTHVGSETGEEDLRRSVEDINKQPNIDFIIVSGDVSQTGKGSDLRIAKSILDNLQKPYYVIPGNHDTKWSESGATDFIKMWGNDRFTFNKGGILFIGFHEGPLMRMGDGHFAPEDLRWLDGILAGVKDKEQPIIIVTHYPVDPQIDNWYEVLDRVKKFNTKLILVGHGHANRQLSFEGVPGVMGRSNLRAGKKIGGYNIVELKSDTAYFAERVPGDKTLPVWCKTSLEKRNYLAETKVPERPDYSANKKYPAVTEKWRKETGFVIASAPAIGKDVIIAGNTSGNVFALSKKDGTGKWSFKTGSAIYSSPAIVGNKVIFGSADSNIYCLNTTTGKLNWKLKTEAAVVAVPVISEGVVYIGGSDNKFRAIELNSGKLLWKFDQVGGFVESKPLIYQNKVIFGAWDSYLYALNKKTGALEWKWNNGKQEVLYSPAACFPVASHGKIFIVAPDRYMTALDANTGKSLWRTNRYLVRESIGISEDGNTVYARCMNDTVLAVNASAKDPEYKWIKNEGYGYDIDPNMPVEKDANLVFGTKDGSVYDLNANTGDLKWVHRTGSALVNNISLINSKEMVITTMDGSIIMLKADNLKH